MSKMVKYVGNKPAKKDSIFNTGTIWHGNGDEQPLDDAIAIALVEKHPDVWQLTFTETCFDEKTAEVLAKEEAAEKAEDAANEKLLRPKEVPGMRIENDELELLSLQKIKAEANHLIKKYNKFTDIPKLKKLLKKEYNLMWRGNVSKKTMMRDTRKFLMLMMRKEALAETGVVIFNGVTVTEQLKPLLAIAQGGNFAADQEYAVAQAIDMLGGIDSGYYNIETGMPNLDAIQLLVGEFVTEALIDTVITEQMD